MCWVITLQSDMVSYTKSCSSLIFNQLENAERWAHGQQFLNSDLRIQVLDNYNLHCAMETKLVW